MLFVFLVREAFHGRYVPLAEVLLNLTFLFPFIPGRHESLVQAGWSLGVEWVFYALFPLFALFSKGVRTSCVLLVVFAFISVGVSDLLPVGVVHFSSMNIPHGLVYFQVGVLYFSLVCMWKKKGLIDDVNGLIGKCFYVVLFALVAGVVVYRVFAPFIVTGKQIGRAHV